MESELFNYHAYLFDFDFTLADASKGIITCFQLVLKRHGWLQITDESIRNTIGMTLEESFSVLTGVSDLRVLKTWKEEYVVEEKKIMAANTIFFDEAIVLLKQLKALNRKIGIISSKHRSTINESIIKYNLQNVFDIVIGIEDVQVAKPDPEGIFTAMKTLNVLPDDVLYVGDNIIDAKAAGNANVDFLAVTTGTTADIDFLPYPYKRILASLAEFVS